MHEQRAVEVRRHVAAGRARRARRQRRGSGEQARDRATRSGGRQGPMRRRPSSSGSAFRPPRGPETARGRLVRFAHHPRRRNPRGLLRPCSPGKRTRETFRVVVVPGLQAHDLRPGRRRGAVGLLVAGRRAGDERAGRRGDAGARASSATRCAGAAASSRCASASRARGRSRTGSGFIVVGLPQGGPQPNNRRFAVAVVGGGYRGVLTSPSTRIPGIVSIADIAPTALGEDGALGSEGGGTRSASCATLDRRIDDHNRWRSRTATWLELALAVLAVVSGTAAVLGAAAFLLANLVLGAVGRRAGRRRSPAARAALAGLPLARAAAAARRRSRRCLAACSPRTSSRSRSTSAGWRCRRSGRRRTPASTGSRTCSRRSC